LIHHADWVASAISLVGTYFVGRKKWWGWLIHVVNLGIFTYINVVFALWGFMPLNMMLLVLYLKNSRNWRVQSIKETGE